MMSRTTAMNTKRMNTAGKIVAVPVGWLLCFGDFWSRIHWLIGKIFTLNAAKTRLRSSWLVKVKRRRGMGCADSVQGLHGRLSLSLQFGCIADGKMDGEFADLVALTH
jgi:hypothetical protein